MSIIRIPVIEGGLSLSRYKELIDPGLTLAHMKIDLELLQVICLLSILVNHHSATTFGDTFFYSNHLTQAIWSRRSDGNVHNGNDGGIEFYRAGHFLEERKGGAMPYAGRKKPTTQPLPAY